jgi:hypothetical protein
MPTVVVASTTNIMSHAILLAVYALVAVKIRSHQFPKKVKFAGSRYKRSDRIEKISL